MLSEHAVIFDPDHVVLVVLIVEVEVLQDLEFHASLVLELFLVSDDLDGDHLLGFVVHAFDGLPKATLSQKLEDFVPVAKMVLEDDLIIALVIVVAMVENVHLLQSLLVPLDVLGRLQVDVLDDVSFDLFLAVLPQVVNLPAELRDLLLFEVVQDGVELLQSVLGFERKLGLILHDGLLLGEAAGLLLSR